MLKPRLLFIVLAVAVTFIAGGVWLYAQPKPITPMTAPTPISQIPQKPTSHPVVTSPRTSPAPPAVGTPSTTAALAKGVTPSVVMSTTHSINWVSIDPPSIIAGSSNPVIITAQIADPAVIRTGVN